MGCLLEATASTGAAKSAGMLSLLLYMVIFGAFFYFVLLKPQRKQQREHESIVSNIAAGDSILTTSGFYGVIIDVMDEIVIVEFGNNKNCRIPMRKDNIVEVEKKDGAE
ncbi:MAG: preprotein translocase subunit YajC [Lachnospiraceae bacterium]|nr:preprotein translocase subunit YajC [Lachnospiraceae bacterium]